MRDAGPAPIVKGFQASFCPLLSPDADVVVSSAKRLSAFAAVWLPPSRPALVGSGQRKYQTIQGQDRRKRIAFGGLWKGRLKSISSRFRETPPAGRPTNCEPSAAGRSWKGGARERADDVFFAKGIKRRRSKADFAPTWYARLDSNQRPLESESSGGQTGNRWGPMVLWVLDRFAKFDRKFPEALQRNASGDFFDSSQIVV